MARLDTDVALSVHRGPRAPDAARAVLPPDAPVREPVAVPPLGIDAGVPRVVDARPAAPAAPLPDARPRAPTSPPIDARPRAPEIAAPDARPPAPAADVDGMSLKALYAHVATALARATEQVGSDHTAALRRRFEAVPPYLEAARKPALRDQAVTELRRLARDLAALGP